MERCFSDKSALLKHEVAYCLGQLGDARAVAKLVDVLADADNQVSVYSGANFTRNLWLDAFIESEIIWVNRENKSLRSPLFATRPAKPWAPSGVRTRR